MVAQNGLVRELLLFWGMHPNAKFDRKAICYALDYSKLDTERALRIMIEEGLLDSHSRNGVTLYSLTKDEERRRPVLELAALGRDRWQLMTKRIEREDKVANCLGGSQDMCLNFLANNGVKKLPPAVQEVPEATLYPTS